MNDTPQLGPSVKILLAADKFLDSKRDVMPWLNYPGGMGIFTVALAQFAEQQLQAALDAACKCVCHSFPEHMRLQDALEALKFNQNERAAALDAARLEGRLEEALEWHPMAGEHNGRVQFGTGRDCWSCLRIAELRERVRASRETK